MDNNPFRHTIETPNLLLLPIQHDDEAVYCHLFTSDDIMKYIAPPISTEKATRSFQAALKMNEAYPTVRFFWAMKDKKSQSTIGIMSLLWGNSNTKERMEKVEVGMSICQSHQQAGIGTEAMTGLMTRGFNCLSVNSIFGKSSPQNLTCTRLMTKLGFIKEECIHDDGTLWFHWLLKKQQWYQHPLYLKYANHHQ
ncbi:GNAT family N-acetyltransferase [Pleionea sp. CnH1-48]|uniref:GNAT family N-acetyltransferase n=1 Tax=Pleionea sp. CnH1-48 TaxID=2954494 RepID=UPI00209714A0|nr:GNAT family N-acetyltransferase [Pleionea sp. CnH1-48]MCO7226887.1 GNAT family N-acetyltransferase [Pleionea sp. CnH1-48]